MREILFRGKRSDNGEWVEGVPFFEENRCYIIEDLFICDEYACTGAVNSMVIPETVGQFTGLTDKNGKKIFEGDIIKSCEYGDVYFVEYCADDGYPAFDVVPEMNIECNGLSHLHIVEGIEVIGNIHDNPELLKGGEAE